MHSLLQDIRQSIRRLARMRGAALAAILTLAVGIGAAATIFSLVYAALLRPLPFAEPGRLAMLSTTRTTAREGTVRARWSFHDITAITPLLTSFDDTASFTRASLSLGGGDAPEQIDTEIVSPSYFRVLRVTPLRGRLFAASGDPPEGEPAIAIISARLWHRRFASDPAVVGRPITIGDVPLTIAGVMPDGFAGLSGRAEAWLPVTLAPRVSYAGYLTTPQHFILLIGRLKPGTSFQQADAEIAAVAPGVVTADHPESPDTARWSATVWPLAQARIDAGVRRSSQLLLAAAAVVLLISCVNVANLLLAQARIRRREIAIRLAIGCSRTRLVRQLLTESVVLASIGGLGGTVIAAWTMNLVVMPEAMAAAGNNYVQVSAFAAPAIDPAFFLCVLTVTAATAVMFGLAPALEASRPGLVTALKDGGRATTGGRRGALAALVISEIALAVVLLAGAGLLLRSLGEMLALRQGFTSDRVLTFWVNAPASRYPDASGPATVERVLARIQQVPGVALAAVNRCTPFGTSCARTTIFFPDRPVTPGNAPVVERHYISADYFRTIGVPLRAGRTIGDRDRTGQPPVAVVNETAARRFWPGESPLGKRVWFGSAAGFMNPDRPVEIVGVVGDVKYGTPDEPIGPDVYTSFLQFTYPSTMVLVKLDERAPASVASLRAAMASIDAGLPINDVRTLDERTADTLSRPRFNAAIVATFSGAALFLAAIGVYGVMAYSVSQRMHEMGVRLALGADPRRLVRLWLGEGARLAGAGAAIGVGLSLAGTRLMRSVLFGVTPTDPVVFVAVPVAMLATALLAAYLPARRASRVDPVVVLRSE